MGDLQPFPPYHDLLVAAMGHELPGQLGRGWMPAGSDGEWGPYRWTRGNGRLRLSSLSAPTRLCVCAGVPVPQLAKPLSILVNGRRVWRGRLHPGFQTIRVDLPRELTDGRSASAGGVLRVALLSRRSVPAQWEAGPDTRSLGVMVRRVWVEAVPEGAHHPPPLRARWRDWLAPLGAGFRERNPTNPRSPLFWILMAPTFLVCLLIGIPLRILRALRLSPRRASVRACERTGARCCDGAVDLGHITPERRTCDAATVRQLVNTFRDSAEAGVWGVGHLRDFHLRRIWRCQHPKPGNRLLHLGCREGQTLALLRLHFGVAGFGVDNSLPSLTVARAAGGDHHQFFLGAFSSLPVKDAAFDLVHVSDALDRVADAGRPLHEVARVLAPGGRAVVLALNADHRGTWHEMKRRLTGGRLGPGGEGGLARHHPGTLRGLLEQEELTVTRITRHHAFFTLLMDERGALLSHPRLWKLPRGLRRLLFRGVGLFERVAQLADEPWIWLGQSNAFVVEARRPPIGD